MHLDEEMLFAAVKFGLVVCVNAAATVSRTIIARFDGLKQLRERRVYEMFITKGLRAIIEMMVFTETGCG